MRVAVAGGTGTVGTPLVTALRAAGADVIVLARSTGVDLVTGVGLREALDSVSVVIDVANAPVTSRRASEAFFGRTTTNLIEAERVAGVGHHVALSIIGIDRVDFGYYLGKRRQEELIRAGSIPWTILRATQFHEFAAQLTGRVRGPLVPIPRMRTQPVAAHETAEFLAELAMTDPAGMTELAGPQIHELVDLARGLLRARGARRWVVPVRLPGATGRGMANGALLPEKPVRLGRQTWDDWLGETVRTGQGRHT